eukprot:TRINITY_DN5751_c0_g1_i3.p1 TRINITY_DN5751_c0_g1~~TRINITY_DN5751_c0_g1_i3.p1  ORF type:complete len:364 (-),score=93.60 TRINITY_DN5751_c0_g1_i3:249-1340(-)
MVQEVSQEISVLSKLRHIGITQFYGLGREYNPANDQFFISIVMEYAPKSLSRFCQDADYDANFSTLALSWAAEIADAMAYLHRNFVHHNDLKPGNVLLTHDLKIKLCDFGASGLRNGSKVIGNTNTLVGTPGYIPPELSGITLHSWDQSFENNKHDVFAFGITLAAIFMHDDPYPSHALLTPAVLQTLISDGYRPIDPEKGWSLPEFCPDGLFPIMEACWQHHSDSRPEFTQVLAMLMELRRELQPDMFKDSELGLVQSSSTVSERTTTRTTVDDDDPRIKDARSRLSDLALRQSTLGGLSMHESDRTSDASGVRFTEEQPQAAEGDFIVDLSELRGRGQAQLNESTTGASGGRLTEVHSDVQ